MPPKTPDHTIAAILEDIKAPEELSTRTIAKRHGVSEGTVRRIAKTHGIEDAFTRANTENATRASVADMAARRAQLASDLLDDVERFRKRAWERYSYWERSRDKAVLVESDLPPLGEQRNAYTSLAICIDKHLALVRADQSAAAGSVGSLLGSLLDDFVNRHGAGPASGLPARAVDRARERPVEHLVRCCPVRENDRESPALVDVRRVGSTRWSARRLRQNVGHCRPERVRAAHGPRDHRPRRGTRQIHERRVDGHDPWPDGRDHHRQRRPR